MYLPGTDWLKRQRAGVDFAGGGYYSRMAPPMRSGAAFGMSVVLVVAWLLSLPVLFAWAGARRVRPRP